MDAEAEAEAVHSLNLEAEAEVVYFQKLSGEPEAEVVHFLKLHVEAEVVKNSPLPDTARKTLYFSLQGNATDRPTD